MDLSDQPQSLRIVVNVLYIAGLFELARRATFELFAA